MCSLCRLPVAKSHNLGQHLTFGELLYRHPFTDEGQILMCYSGPRCRLDQFILSPSVGEKLQQFLPFFGLRHLVVSLFGSSLKKLNTAAQLQIFPLSVLQRLHGAIGRTISDVQKRDEQTNRQTDRQTKTQRFWPPRRRVKSEPHQTWHSDRGPRARSCTSKIFEV